MPDRQAVTYGPESGATAVEPDGDVVGGVYFRGSPEFSVTDENAAPTGNVVYTVRERGEAVLAARGTIRYDGHVTRREPRVNETGVEGLGFGCAS